MKVNKNIAVSESGFLFDSLSGDSFSLNPIAAEILELIRDQKSPAEIKRELLQKYDVSSSVLDKSIDEYIYTLKKLSIIK
ncbi:MAG: HPr-rel-A system PqqD family peptide chaperone [Ignavibacteriae bacterium]|jgi:PqqD family protein of HPr-rel-A system|nr:HPr-rel-A system PqqD family peptide chaperone [Ignavibacteriota bacterium]